MSVSNGREFLAIPGPTTVPDAVLQAMHRPAVDIYSGGLPEMTESLIADLRALLRTSGNAYIYAANGHGAWEAAITNTLSRGDKILVLGTGRFAIGWGEMAGMLGIDVEVMNFGWRSAVDPAKVQARLTADVQHAIKAVLVVQVDTASGVVNDVPAIRAAIRSSGHPALFMVDTIASLGCMPYDMEAWDVDLTVAACQKGLMTPPGLSYVGAGPRALAAHKSAGLRTFYWDWTFRDGPVHYMKYCGTPPEHLLFAQRKALDLIHAEGLDAVYSRHTILARAVQAAVAAWSESGALSFNIPDKAARAVSVTTVRMDNPQRLIDFCSRQCGVVLGVGIGDMDGKAFRIAHMGHVNAPMVLGTLATIEAGLQALRIPHGAGGTAAAIAAIADALRN